MTTKAIIRAIARADAESIDPILEAAMRRKRALYPDWELIYAALPRQEGKTRQTAEQILRLLNRERET